MAQKVLGIPSDIFAGLLLATAALAGILFENISALAPYYDALLGEYATVAVADLEISKPLLLWINDGLMAVFFLLVALEIKREVKAGALSNWQAAALPVYGALGGIVIPSLIFLAIVGIDSAEARGWAIPAATDIAFALGVLSLFGNKVPPVLKTFLLALAVVDDLAAIVIIALFYTSSLSVMALSIAAVCLAVLLAMNLLGSRNWLGYFIVGLILWTAVLKSGVHATLAGVALGFAIPFERDGRGRSLALDTEHELHPWVSFLILPVFAFANAGVPLAGLSLETLMHPLSLGVAAGLFVGKQLGVFGVVWLAVRSGLATRPEELSWRKLYGAACLAGIGFTMSLFIGSLAFTDVESQNAVRIGVLSGSILSGLLGAIVLSQARVVRPARIEA
ncbi:Na+/H+ antiporter NhaA [Marimonas arenosa]|uniref:Na(+)/H(+) antiporter NhaA n=1 Tax=Marimonas arenosa TaxID=1795305 RepID=A0AAE3WB53_9RHOB|nr:Na+/H+ antiporter NhaA [Marimonas arenosa]MDQ2089220.1 Na+/H+ antiporter NhaA [Marimonas arenosa]